MKSAGESTATRHVKLNVRRTGIVLKPNNSRVVIRPFEPPSNHRIERIIARIVSLSDLEVDGATRRRDAQNFTAVINEPATFFCTGSISSRNTS